MYTVLRTKKLKTMQDVAGAGAHVFRLRKTPNADPAKQHLNEVLVRGGGNQLHKIVGTRIKEGVTNPKAQIRKNSVRVIEFILSASPEFFDKASKDEEREWLRANVQWLRSKYGAKNVVSVVCHRDEKTMHLHAFVVPVTSDGRLSAKEMIGGTRQVLRDLQTDYAKAMAHFGLSRGVENSRADHTTISEYYKAINSAFSNFKSVKVATPSLFNRGRFAKKVESVIEGKNRTIAILRNELKRTSQNKLVKENKELEDENKKLLKKLSAERERRLQSETYQEIIRRDKIKKQEKIDNLNHHIQNLEERIRKLNSKYGIKKGPSLEHS